MDKEVLKLIATKDDLKDLVTKKGFAEFRDENLTRLDEMMTILKRLKEVKNA